VCQTLSNACDISRKAAEQYCLDSIASCGFGVLLSDVEVEIDFVIAGQSASSSWCTAPLCGL
jgi:hypothetical protein